MTLLKLSEKLAKIGNREEVKEACEPNICYRMELKPWMVKRVIIAMDLYLEETDNEIKET